MPLYRESLPQLSGRRSFVTDGGLETTLIHLEGVDLPEFAACELLRSQQGVGRLRRYYESYIALAIGRGLGFVLDTPTWRANPDWTARLGYDDDTFAAVNRAGVALAAELRDRLGTEGTPIVVAATVGPRGDGYRADTTMTPDDARAYHRRQIELFAASEADLVVAYTIPTAAEGLGIVLAARDAGLPVVLSFTVETDGALPSGETLREAVETVDAATGAYPSYFMVNCAHPTALPGELASDAPWTHRIRGLRPNASTLSHAELDDSDTLDDGDPDDLAARLVALRARMPGLTVFGGCCGTDLRHLTAIAQALAA